MNTMENELNTSMYDSIESSLNKKRNEYANILAKIKNMNVSSSFEDINCIIDDLISVRSNASKVAICNVLLKRIAAVHASVQRMITTMDDTAEWLNAICKYNLLPSNEVQSIMKQFNFRYCDNVNSKFTKFDPIEDIDMSSLDEDMSSLDEDDANESDAELAKNPNAHTEENVKDALNIAKVNDPCNPWPFNETTLSCNDASKTNIEASALSNSCVTDKNDANQPNSKKDTK